MVKRENADLIAFLSQIKKQLEVFLIAFSLLKRGCKFLHKVYSSRFFFLSPNIASKLVIAKPKTDIALDSSPVCGKVFWPLTEPGAVCIRAAGAEPVFVDPAWLSCLFLSS